MSPFSHFLYTAQKLAEAHSPSHPLFLLTRWSILPIHGSTQGLQQLGQHKQQVNMKIGNVPYMSGSLGL